MTRTHSLRSSRFTARANTTRPSISSTNWLTRIGDNPRDPRYRFIETLSVLIEAYDAEHHALADASGLEVLKYLMEQHGLTQSDLPEIGSQGVVSEVLRRKART